MRPIDPQAGPSRPLPLSKRLAQIVENHQPDRLTFTELAAQLHSRAWGGLLLIFAAINVLPLPPGTSVFFAIPLMIVSAQMVLGRASPWFPASKRRLYCWHPFPACKLSVNQSGGPDV